MFKATVAIVCGLLVLQQGAAQIISTGTCPDVTVVQDFDATSFIGTWYEQSKYFAIFELGGSCITATYAATDDASVITVVNQQYNVLTQSTSSIEGTATLQSTTGEAKLEVVFSTTPFPAPYWVLGTDYENYAVIFSCADFLDVVNGQFVWILTRDQAPSDEVLEAAYSVLDSNNLSRDNLQITDQTNCSA